MLGLPYSFENVVLVTVQAACLALVGAGMPAALQRLAGRWWASALPLSLGGVVAAIAVAPGTADALTWLALVAVPPLAAAGLGWAMRGARPPLALLAVPLLVVAWTAQHETAGDLARLALVVLANVTLGRLLVAAAPLSWVRAGVVVMAVLDAILVFSGGLEQPNATLNAAVPAEGLPQLQFARLDGASFGFGDLFVAAVAGAVVAADRLPPVRTALLCLAVSLVYDLLFWVTDSVAGTVPVAVALVISTAIWRPRTANFQPSGVLTQA